MQFTTVGAKSSQKDILLHDLKLVLRSFVSQNQKEILLWLPNLSLSFLAENKVHGGRNLNNYNEVC